MINVPSLPDATPYGAIQGITIAQVTACDDPDGLGRVKVSFMLYGKSIESDWLQVMTFFAGPGHGAQFLPQRGHSALVAFADGDPNQPFVLGFLWNGGIKPPIEGAARQQDVRVISTAKGKKLIFDDSQEGQLTIIDEKQNKVQIDTAGNRIVVESKGDVSVTAAGTLTLKGSRVLIQNTSGSVKLDLAAAALDVSGGQSMKLAATMIDIN